jgi:hypothetical protein
MQIVREFREMAGAHGRTAHRAWPIPSYDYQKGLTKEAKEAMETSKGNRMPNMAGVDRGAANIEDGVDNQQAGRGHFARWGEPGSSGLGEHAGQHLPRRVVGGGIKADHGNES